MARDEASPKFSFKDLEEITDGFSEENYIGQFQFGKLYRGKVNSDDGPRFCTVKIWEIPELYVYCEGDNEGRLRDELSLLEHKKFNFHPGLVKLYGYCADEEKLGVIYDLNPLDTVHNLVLKDSFTWLQRIKVALRFANLLTLFHGGNPMGLHLLVRNLSAAHIVLDEDYNPKLFDFGLISGGIFPDRTIRHPAALSGCIGYISKGFYYSGYWCEGCDVFAFGVLLLMLITKRVYKEEDRMNEDVPKVYEWAQTQYKPKKTTLGYGKSGCSLVHESLEKEPVFCSRDGRQITKLAMQCVAYYSSSRPTMRQVVKRLQKLHVVRHHAISPM